MDVWELAIIGGAGLLALRLLLETTGEHEKRHRRKREREWKADRARAEAERVAAEAARSEDAA